jgi:hypothetical protein
LLPTGGQDPHVPASLEHGLHKRGRRLEKVLAVVEDEERIRRPEMIEDRVAGGAIRLLRDPDRVHDGFLQQRRIRQGRELNQPDPVECSVAQGSAPDLDREAGLSCTPSTRQGDQGVLIDQFADRQEFLRSAC